jgi:hypothetical protein
MAPAAAAPRRAAIVAALFGFGAYAGLAVGSGLDRASETQPAIAARVPRLLASEALRSEGRQALAKGDGPRALALGERAVADAPLDPASTALLGAARYATGDRGGADRAFRLAAQLGWRIPYTQLYMMGRALEVGDYRVAALRLDALARQNPAALDDRRLFDPFERSAAGRAALADRLATKPPWLRPYAMAVQALPPDRLAQRVAVLNALEGRGTKVGCTPIGAPVSRLIASGALADAARLWRGHCPAAAGTLLYDGNFAAASLDQSESEFAWTFIGQSEVSVVIEPAGADPARTLVIDSTAARPMQVVRQLVLLSPGAYRLSWQADNGSGTPSAQVLAQFSCEPASSEGIEPQFDPAHRRWSARLAMDAGCPARWIGFAVKPGASGVRLRDVRLDPGR